MPQGRLSGKVALVTGASRGIGAVTAARLARDGARVVVNYNRNKEEADAVVQKIRSAGGEATAAKGDVTDPKQVKPLFDAVFAAYGRLDILVNNAGTFDMKPLAEIDGTEGQFEKMFNLNTRATLLASAEAARRFGPDGGRIINMSSVAARSPTPGASVYAASKAAVEALTRCHAHELGPKKVTVNAVAPATTGTEAVKAGVPEEVKRQIVRNTALGRMGTPEDIADVIAFLASDDARWVTGCVVDVNGGFKG